MIWICTRGIGPEARRKAATLFPLRLLHLGLGLLRAGTNVGLGLVDGCAQVSTCLLPLGGGLTSDLSGENETESAQGRYRRENIGCGCEFLLDARDVFGKGRQRPTFDAAADTGLTTSSLTALAAASAFSIPGGSQETGNVRNGSSDGESVCLFILGDEVLGIAFMVRVRRAATKNPASDPLDRCRNSLARLTRREGVANLVVDVLARSRGGIEGPARSSKAEGSDGSAVHLLRIFSWWLEGEE